MQYWSEHVTPELSEEYGLMEDLRQIRDMDFDEENLYYSRYTLQHLDELEDYNEDDLEDDLEEDEDLDDCDDEDDFLDDEEEEDEDYA